MSETISQLPPATKANSTDLVPVTQGSNGPGTGTSRAATVSQVIAGGLPAAFSTMSATAPYSTAGHNLVVNTFTVDTALTDSSVNPTLNVTNVNASSGGHELWVNFDSTTYSVPGGDAASGGNIVGRYVGMRRTTAAPNVPFDGLIVGMSDATGLATSLSGGLYGVEIDLSANGNDDSGSQLRRGLWIALGKEVNADAAPQASIGIGIISGSGTPFSGSNGLGFFVPISIQTPFRDAGIDFRSSSSMSGGTGNAVWLKTGQTIAFDTAGAASASAVTLSSVTNAITGTNSLALSTSLQIGTNNAANINLDSHASPNVFTVGLPWRVPGYATASLPALTGANQGTIAFANDARNSGEGGGGGTGCLVCVNKNGTWVAVWSGVAPIT